MPSSTLTIATHPLRRPSVALAAIAVSALALSACSSGSDSAGGGNGVVAAATTSAGGDPRTVTVTMTADGCPAEKSSYTAGPLTFKVSNTNATGVTEFEILQGERILAEKENLPPGFSGSFSLNIQPGTYSLYCPGAKTERSPFTVTGTATSAAASDTGDLLAAGTKTYATYVNNQIGLLADGVKVLQSALAVPQTATSLAAAQQAYAKARVYYERVEPVAESFTTSSGSLDAAIDARADDVPLSKLTGFHRIEYGLFSDKSFVGLTAIATKLATDVDTLKGLTAKLTYQPAELANGAVGLLDEVQKSKVTGEEERYSHIDLVDFQANVEGSQQAFANLQPGLAKIDSVLTGKVQARFDSLDTLLSKYRSTTTGTGFVSYTTLTTADKQALSRAVQSVSEPLSQVAGKVVNS